MTTLLFFLIISLVLSSFFSGTEMAFTSSNKVQMREKADTGDDRAKKVVRLHEDPERFLTSILIGNNVVNVSATALVTYGMQVYLGIQNEWVITLIMTPLLLIFGEMLPKDYCRLKSQSVLLKYSGVLTWVVRLLHFPSTWILKAIKFLLTPFGAVMDKSIFVSEREFRLLIEESAKAGVVEQHEKQMIDTILDFEHTKTESVMTPLDKVVKIDIHATVGEVKKLASRTKARMVLIYEEDPEIVVGMIYVFDLLFEENEAQGLGHFLRSPIFLPGHASIETSFLTLQQKRQSYAVVTNDSGEAIGAVPIERLLVYK